jgi:hypothetical protein
LSPIDTAQNENPGWFREYVTFLFLGDKYQKYFDVYQNWAKTEKRKYGWSSMAFIVGVIFFLLEPLTTHGYTQSLEL